MYRSRRLTQGWSSYARALLLIVLGLVLISWEPAHAASCSWNVGSGDWFTATNWSPNGVPGSADNVVIGSGTCTLNAAATITNLTLSSGILTGSGTLDVSGVTSWSGGSMSGTGTTNANGAVTMSGPNDHGIDPGRTFNINASATLTAGRTYNSGTLNIAAAATFDVQMDDTFGFANGGTVNNAGTFQKSAGGGTFGSQCVFNNTGTVQSLSGTLGFDSYTQTAGVTRLNGGAIGAAST